MLLLTHAICKTRTCSQALEQGTMVYGDDPPTTAAPWPDDRVKRAVATISFDSASPAPAQEGLTLERMLHDVLPAR